MNGFQFVKETDKAFTLLNPGGFQVEIAKEGVSDQTAKRIRTLPKPKSYVDGGLVSMSDEFGDEFENPQPTNGGMTYQPDTPEEDLAYEQQKRSEAAIKEATTPTPQPAQPSQPIDQSYLADYQKGFGMMQKGLQGEANAEAMGQQAMAQAQQGYADQLKVTETEYANRRKALDDETAVMQKDVENTKIDPNRYWNQMGSGEKTGKKILAFIGMVLGGPAQMKTGVNPFGQVLGKIIQDDIDSQKENLQTKKGLLHQQFQKYGNLRDAENATRLNMLAMMEAQVKKLSAQTQSEAVKQKAMQGIGQLQVEQAKLKHELAGSQTVQSMLGALQGKVPIEAVPEKYRELMAPTPDGGWTLTTSKNNAEELQKAYGTIGTLKDTIARAREHRKGKFPAAFGDVPLARTGTEYGEKGVRLEKEMIDQLRQLGTNLRLSDSSMDHMTALAVNPTQWGFEKNVMSNLDDLESYLDRLYANQLASRSGQASFKKAGASFKK